jgi:PAS domain S-box-containing protein
MKKPSLDSSDLAVLKPILDALPFYVLLVDEEHRILTANTAVQRDLDKRPAEIVGCHCPEAIHGSSGEYAGCPMEQAKESGEAVEKEFFDDETDRWIESMIYPVETGGADAETARLFVHFVRDISERKRLEQIAVSRERLARVGEISAGIAHTFRNPLHGLLSSVARLDKRFGGQDQEAAEILSWMREGLNRLERVTRRMLTLTREVPLVKRPVALAAVVDDALALVSQGMGGVGPALVPELAKLPPIHLDPDRLGEVVVNLLDNAVFACGDGGTVTVSTGLHTANPHRQSGTQYQYLMVEDDGPGMSAEVQERVFDPFFTTKGVGEGSGLGLAIARRVIREHGGEVQIRSVEGQGTRVRVTLPAR